MLWNVEEKRFVVFPLNQTDNAGTFLMKWQKTWFQCAPQGDFTPFIHGSMVLRNLQRWKEKCKRPSPLPNIWLKGYAINIHVTKNQVNKSCTLAQLLSHKIWASHSCVTSYMLCICQALVIFTYAPAQLHRSLWLRPNLQNESFDQILL